MASPPSLPIPTFTPHHRTTPSNISASGASLGTSRIPTGTAAEPLNIVILGASFAGLSAAHHFLDHTLPQLRAAGPGAPAYRLVLVSPSSCLYWNIGAPRWLVSEELLASGGDSVFPPIEDGFHRHRGHLLTFIQGSATGIDVAARAVTVEPGSHEAQKRLNAILPKRESVLSALTSSSSTAPSATSDKLPPNETLSPNLPKRQNLKFHALMLCTGTAAHSDLLSLHGPHTHTLAALRTFYVATQKAHSIVIAGGGPSGVETAGQLATYLNYTRHFPLPRRIANPKNIILLSGSARCLPSLPARIGAKAERKLRKLGVDVRHHVRVTGVSEWFDQTGATRLTLDDETDLVADLYIPATGVVPCTSYAPESWRDGGGYIRTEAEGTLRVEGVERVYALGDVGAYSRNYVLDVYAAVPAVMHNLRNDLLAWEIVSSAEYGLAEEARTTLRGLRDEKYENGGAAVDSLLVPISRFGGVGVLMGLGVPGVMVHVKKGRDYLVRKARGVVGDGGNPYAVMGRDV